MKAEIYKDDLGKEYEVTDIPEDMKELADEWREKLLESVAELDEDLMMKFLEGEEITQKEIKNGDQSCDYQRRDDPCDMWLRLQEQGRPDDA